ncbi:peptidase [Clostridiales bacterium PH28_bin88]|nr:peptidase [Clostridiales bacterium PH28_bin88]
MFFHWSELLVLPAVLLAMYAQFKVKSTFHKYQNMPSLSGKTGAEVARSLLNGSRLQNVLVELSQGFMTDHYDPRAGVVRLSPEVYHGQSVAALGVAAHEVGHAVQHGVAYVPLLARNSIFPVANIASTLAMPMFIIGLLLKTPFLMAFGIIAFTGAVIFQLITLPVEFNASRRALALLSDNGYLIGSEKKAAKAVLGAAALTYLAATLVAFMELVKLVIMMAESREE